MNKPNNLHSFHIPVMGIGFTIDTAVKVAPYGISSVISLVDDMLMEKMRKFYCEKINQPYLAITEKTKDFRADRITAYLNLIDKIVKDKFEELKNSIHEKGSEIFKYIEMLPDISDIKKNFKELINNKASTSELFNWINEHLYPGSIDVNIMTKLDKPNYDEKEKLPVEFNDAHSALRGFANSDLKSSIVLSAGINTRLYSYFETFEDFYPDSNLNLNKKITLKVSDYRSAIIQSKLFAKKGLWVSEYRIESGLNCGGHAFATEGHLMGPILQEFKNNKENLINSTFELYIAALKSKNKAYPSKPYKIKITAQGGVTNNYEHNFLLNHYNLDSVGWGTLFLLVPEVVNVNEDTLKLLCDADKDDLYLSDISPLGIKFNSIKGNSKDIEKQTLIDKGKPGSNCNKKYACLNSELSSTNICTASKHYQKLKILQLEQKNLNKEEYEKEYKKITDKACICNGLGTTALLVNNIDTTFEGTGVSICPGPSMEYFNKIVTLSQMLAHIYGKSSVIDDFNYPDLFLKEIYLYINFLKNKYKEAQQPLNSKQLKYFTDFKNNLIEGINYYKVLYSKYTINPALSKDYCLNLLADYEKQINTLF
ncbi:MAG: hypothetical protein KA792_11205 [Bacteroidales bacterium]|nr:hypothetical protein [Bacteroidales bacterium]